MAGTGVAAAMAARSLGGAVCRLSAPLRCLDRTARSSVRRVVGTARLVKPKEVMRRTPCGADFTAVVSSRDRHLRWLSTTATSAAGEGGGGDGSGEGGSPGYREKERELTEKLQQALTAEKVVVEDASGAVPAKAVH
ncbi:hypothetical protein CBR_g39422 [Chara braunii]|uniref:Uncharacterized protein n=1 Tax=Chara braunii TaxID=69332 RepID=A0A388LRT2_CHABU|nr:hypothetical protein CBR_g39422 [Chara braunii]|eukprot:GBG84959.1 hypothetical protein CBR_g39422 [Chara braunii]